jgi:hypothetical protein
MRIGTGGDNCLEGAHAWDSTPPGKEHAAKDGSEEAGTFARAARGCLRGNQGLFPGVSSTLPD